MASLTLNQAREAVYQRFVAQWGARTIFTLDGEDFTEPAGQVYWCRVAFRHVGGGQDTQGPIGARKYRRRALVHVQLFGPRNQGTRTLDEHAQFARAIFEGTSFAGIDCQDGRAREIQEPGREPRWLGILVEVDADYDETK